MHKDFFVSNGRKEVDDGCSHRIYGEPKTISVIKLDSCDIKPVSLLNIRQKTKLPKKPNSIIWYRLKL